MKTIIIVSGQTATGKSDLAVELALRHNGEVISCDSRQVYKELDLLSGKITNEEMKGVPHHLLDIASLFDLPEHPVTVALFQKLARAKIEEILSRGKTPILCGGTGLYIDAVMDEKYEFESQIPQMNTDFLSSLQTQWIGLAIPMPELRKRIRTRVEKRIKQGMIEELQQIIDSGISYEVLQSLGLEMKYISQYLKQELQYDEMIELLSIKIGQYAKRQMTWFKRNEKIQWFNPLSENLCLSVESAIIRDSKLELPFL